MRIWSLLDVENTIPCCSKSKRFSPFSAHWDAAEVEFEHESSPQRSMEEVRASGELPREDFAHREDPAVNGNDEEGCEGPSAAA
jgi:hypothetical protein